LPYSTRISYIKGLPNGRDFSVTMTPVYLDTFLKPSPTSHFSGQVKVSNLTPERRSPCRMGNGEGRVRIEGLDKKNIYDNLHH